MKLLSHQGKLKEYITNKPTLQKKMLREVTHAEGKWFQIKIQTSKRKVSEMKNI